MKVRFFVLVLLWFATIPAVTQTLSIGECVRLAREHYPAVAQYGLLDKVARFNLANAAKVWLPQGSVSAQVSWQNEVAALPDILTSILTQQGMDYPGLGKTQYRVGADVTQQIWDGGRAKANRRTIVTGAAVDRHSIDVQLYDVEGRVEEIYFSILLLDERIRRTDKSIALVDSTFRQVRSMLAEGVAMSSDCDQIEARLLGLKQQKTQLAATRGSFLDVLALFIGEHVGERNLVLPPDEELAVADPVHPQLRLFDARISDIMSQEAVVKASTLPAIGAFVSGYYGYPGYNMFRNMQSRDMSVNFMAGVKVSWNFGALYTRNNSMAKLRQQRDRIEVERSTFLLNNDMAATESMRQIEALRDVMVHDERIVELRRSVTAAARSQLRNGIIDTTALLSKITDEELAENDLVQHRIELTKALYNLNHIRNR